MIELVFSYCHVDEALRNELEIHLAMLKRENLISAWHDRRITAGQELDGTISEHFERAGIVLLLVSPHFLASGYCYDEEMTRALERHAAGEARVIPVILQPCDWLNSPLKALRATPRDGKPVAKHANINDALLEVTQDIRAAIRELDLRAPVVRAEPPLPSPQPPAAQRAPRSSNLRVKQTFSDHERDLFLEKSFEYIANYFEGSLSELKARHPQTDGRFRRIDANHFSASIYLGGQKASGCRLWLGGDFGSNAIFYSGSDEGRDSSWNEQMTVDDDGYRHVLSPLGMLSIAHGKGRASALTQEGAAEYFWEQLIEPLQR